MIEYILTSIIIREKNYVFLIYNIFNYEFNSYENSNYY